ncbi:hypothetical protein DFH28DRAFT_921767 [Melampsora americana]|nr:hypothetical protein DFH28DRAFT_921767 [Melampsora americana]
MATPTIPTPFIPATGAQIVSRLESIADSLNRPTNTQTTTCSTQQTTTTPQPEQPDHTRKRRNTKTINKKTKKNKSISNTIPEINIADIQATKKTAVELRCLAEKHAQTGMSQEIFESVLKFHEEIETLMAIKALELGTTVSDIEEILNLTKIKPIVSGKYIGVRRASAWNGVELLRSVA